MDKLKLYAAPLIALVLLLAWFFVIKPRLDRDERPSAEPTEGGVGPAPQPTSPPSR